MKSIPKKLWSKFRHEISSEIHRKPYYELIAPLRASVFSIHTKDFQKNYYHLDELCKYLSIPSPTTNNLTYLYNYKDLYQLKWESHREFCTFQFIIQEEIASDNLFKKSNIKYVPDLWIDSLDNIINCVNLEVIDNSNLKNEQDIYSAFNNNYIVGSKISNQKAKIYSDFRIDGNGYHRLLMVNNGMSRHQLGRSIQRILDIESYRSLHMVGFVNCSSINKELDIINNDLNQINKNIDSSDNLRLLYDISSKINWLDNSNRFRFQASNSYFPIIEDRFNELLFKKIDGLQPYDQYLKSRLNPTRRTIMNTERRLKDTMNQVSRLSILLQTNTEMDIKKNSYLLLESMNKKTDTQIQLQKTVESLSTIVLTYYSTGLLNYSLKVLYKIYEIPIPIEILTGVGMLPIGLTFFWLNHGLGNKITQN